MRLGPVGAVAGVGDQGDGELEHRRAGGLHDVLDHLGGLVKLGLGHLEQELVVDLCIACYDAVRNLNTET